MAPELASRGARNRGQASKAVRREPFVSDRYNRRRGLRDEIGVGGGSGAL